jgi:pyridoxal phosphate enzyme (YggS family)
VTAAERFAAVRGRIAAACARAGRDPDSVQLLAASKHQPEAALRSAYALGQREFGENYVQELTQKAAALADLSDVHWHLIGRLQTNKVKDVLRVGSAVQSLDSLKLCEALATRAAAAQQNVSVFVQVNISNEAQKAGASVAAVPQLVAAIRSAPSLRLRGLMALPKPTDDPELARDAFRRLRELAHSLSLTELSMGMSDDLELAIEEGATIVRVGTALFGARNP